MQTHNTSELNRIAQCLGSLKLADVVERRYPASSTSKEEGEAAHWLAKTVLSGEFTLEELNDRKAPNGYYVTPEMSEYVSRYLDALPRDSANVPLGTANVPLGTADVPTSFTLSGDIQISGRADHIATDQNTLYVDAFHYGFRIVPVVDNWSLIAHALGYCYTNSTWPERVVLTVHQPRAYRPSGIPAQITLTYDELLAKQEELHARLTGSQDTCTTGPACTICPFAHGCSAFNSASMNAIDVSESVLPVEPKGEDLALLLDLFTRADEVIKARLKSLRGIAEHEIASGAVVPGYALERKSGALRWNDGMTPELVEMLIGHDVSKPEKAMITPTQARTRFKIADTVIETLATRPETAPQLVRISADAAARRVFDRAP